MQQPFLEVNGLSIDVGGSPGGRAIVRDVSFSLEEGKRLGIVGESGSGKSMTARAVAGLLPAMGRVVGGSVRLRGAELLSLRDSERSRLLGTGIGMIFQDPLGSLNPVIKVGEQISEGLRIRVGATRRSARERAIDLMNAVGIPDASSNYHAYPHEFSGGMRQRVMIAIALSMEPELVIADEPTTALDVTVAAQVLDLLSRMCDELGTALILISHDVRTLERTTDDLIVMYAGRVVEAGPTAKVADAPLHPYAKGLLASIPPHDRKEDRLAAIEGASWAGEPPRSMCAFAPRCPLEMPKCNQSLPLLEPVDSGDHRAACFAVSGELS